MIGEGPVEGLGQAVQRAAPGAAGGERRRTGGRFRPGRPDFAGLSAGPKSGPAWLTAL